MESYPMGKQGGDVTYERVDVQPQGELVGRDRS